MHETLTKETKVHGEDRPVRKKKNGFHKHSPCQKCPQ